MSSGVVQSAARSPAPGTVLCGKYRVERELGSGGMGTVVVARHLRLDRPVAIKLLPASRPGDPYLASRVLREARAMARLSSEHVVRVLDLDELPGGAPVLVMELLDGVDLEQVLAQGPVEAPRAVDWALQACAALAEAHARGIVHRDVKPANLFLVRRVDGVELLKLLDFGISKVAGEDLRLTQTAMGLGSPLFMSPEQLLAPSQVDSRTDLWSLGVTLYRLLSGRAPYDAKELSSLSAQIAAQPPTPLLQAAPGFHPALAAVVMRCLEKSVEARWPDVVQLARALEPFRAPAGLGALAAVQLAHAQGVAAASTPSAEEPAAAEAPLGARTLSHDVPRQSAPAVVPAAAARSSSAAPAGRGRAFAPWPAAALALALAGGLVGWRFLGATAPAPSPLPPAPVESAPLAVKVDAPAAALPAGEALAPTPARPDAGAVAAARPARPAVPAAKNPADLEIKE